MVANFGALFQGLASGAQTGINLGQQQQRLELAGKQEERAQGLADLQNKQFEASQRQAALAAERQNLGLLLKGFELGGKRGKALINLVAPKLEMDPKKNPAVQNLLTTMDSLEADQRKYVTGLLEARRITGRDDLVQMLVELGDPAKAATIIASIPTPEEIEAAKMKPALTRVQIDAQKASTRQSTVAADVAEAKAPAEKLLLEAKVAAARAPSLGSSSLVRLRKPFGPFAAGDEITVQENKNGGFVTQTPDGKNVNVPGSVIQKISVQGTETTDKITLRNLGSAQDAVSRVVRAGTEAIGLISGNPDALTNAGSLVRIGVNLASDVVGLARQAGKVFKNDDGSPTSRNPADYTKTLNTVLGTAKDNAALRALSVNLAYAAAVAADDSGRVSDKDVDLQLKQIGLDFSNADVATDTLTRFVQRTYDNFASQHKRVKKEDAPDLLRGTPFAKQAETEAVPQMPANKADLQTGQVYNTPRGLAKWTGTNFIKVNQ